MPFGDFVNQIPTVGFLAIHVVLFALGAYFAWRSFGIGSTTLGWAFSLFALAIPMYLLFEVSILIGRLAQRRRRKRDEASTATASGATGTGSTGTGSTGTGDES